MSESKMREALLKQAGTSSVDSELRTLTAIMEADDRRSRRLTRWTIAVWIVWPVCVATLFLFPVYMARSDPAAPPQPPNAFVDAVVLGLVMVIAAGAVILPVIGTVLLILTVFSRRSASISQLQASVAAIDAQLKALLASKSDEGSAAKSQL